VRGSKFVKYQECKVQESPDEVRACAAALQGQAGARHCAPVLASPVCGCLRLQLCVLSVLAGCAA
jgi:hypothetical protein